jgi:hypothetical protein
MYKIVQLIWRADDAEDDAWYDVCLELLPEDKAKKLAQIIALFKRIGQRTKTHILCWTDGYSKKDGLTKKELEELRIFDPADYVGGAPPEDAAVVITERFVVHCPDYS